MLKKFKKEQYIPPQEYFRYLVLQLLYYCQLAYSWVQWGRSAERDLLLRTLRALRTEWDEVRQEWLQRIKNYRKNMQLRNMYAAARALKVKEPKSLAGMQGKKVSAALTLENPAPIHLELVAIFAFPSKHWRLEAAECSMQRGAYVVKNLRIDGGGKAELKYSISIPRALEKSEYYYVVKFMPRRRLELLAELR
jgi:hypothetical protein